MNFAGKIGNIKSHIYQNICLYVRLQNPVDDIVDTVTALEPYTHVVEDYAFFVYSWSRALHLFIRTR